MSVFIALIIFIALPIVIWCFVNIYQPYVKMGKYHKWENVNGQYYEQISSNDLKDEKLKALNIARKELLKRSLKQFKIKSDLKYYLVQVYNIEPDAMQNQSSVNIYVVIFDNPLGSDTERFVTVDTINQSVLKVDSIESFNHTLIKK